MSIIQLIEADIHQERKLRDTAWKSPQELIRWLEGNGFKQLGKGGAFAVAFAVPGHKRIVRLSKSEDYCWTHFAEWAMDFTDNPHIPHFYWTKWYDGTRNGKPQKFTVSIVERLEEFDARAIAGTTDLIALVELWMAGSIFDDTIERMVQIRLEREGLETDEQIQRFHARHQNSKFSKTLAVMRNMAQKTGCEYDFHNENLMYRPQTRSIVLIDPLADFEGLTLD